MVQPAGLVLPPQPPSSDAPTPIGAIVGATVGGMVAVAVALGVMRYVFRRRSKAPPGQEQQADERDMMDMTLPAG